MVAVPEVAGGKVMTDDPFVVYGVTLRPKLALTQKRLKEMLHYDPQTGLFTRRVAANNRVRVGEYAGTYRQNCERSDYTGYILISVDGHSYRAHHLVWLYTYGHFPTDEIDHIDKDGTNNRLSNLIEV